MRWREWERKQGLCVAKETVLCSKLYGYRIEEDGCYAVPELLENVKKIYAMAMEHGNMKPVIAWLNRDKIMNSKEFFIQQGDKYEAKYDPGWNKVKVINLIKNREYVQYCSHYEKCMERGRRHCEKMPIVDQQTYDEVLEICKKRLSDSES